MGIHCPIYHKVISFLEGDAPAGVGLQWSYMVVSYLKDDAPAGLVLHW